MIQSFSQNNCQSDPNGCLEAMTVGVLVTCNVGCQNIVSVFSGLEGSHAKINFVPGTGFLGHVDYLYQVLRVTRGIFTPSFQLLLINQINVLTTEIILVEWSYYAVICPELAQLPYKLVSATIACNSPLSCRLHNSEFQVPLDPTVKANPNQNYYL